MYFREVPMPFGRAIDVNESLVAPKPDVGVNLPSGGRSGTRSGGGLVLPTRGGFVLPGDEEGAVLVPSARRVTQPSDGGLVHPSPSGGVIILPKPKLSPPVEPPPGGSGQSSGADDKPSAADDPRDDSHRWTPPPEDDVADDTSDAKSTPSTMAASKPGLLDWLKRDNNLVIGIFGAIVVVGAIVVITTRT